MFICDTHADTLYAIGVEEKTDTDITYDKLRQGGVCLQALALWTGPQGAKGDVPLIIAKELGALETLKAQAFYQVDDPSQAQEGRVNIMLTIEGGELFDDGLHTIPYWRKKGVRMAAVTWNHPCRIGYPAASGEERGLTEYGLKAVKLMQHEGIAVDTSHLNEQGFYDIFLKTHTPPLASHSCCRALCDHFRNLTDDQLRLMISGGGYIGVNFYPCFLTGSTAQLQDVVHHIDHICQLGGIKHVGFGSDFDGIECHPHGLRDARDYPALLDALLDAGYSQADIEGIAGGNLLAYYQRIS